MSYNGHKNWLYWNVSLWIANDEHLYRFALECLQNTNNRMDAARLFVDTMGRGSKTPDGAAYSYRTVNAAMDGLA